MDIYNTLDAASGFSRFSEDGIAVEHLSDAVLFVGFNK